MRSFSTPQSALNGEITKLAIFECIGSVALYVGIGLHFGTLRYLAWAVVVAPLMLFRTDASAEWGLRAYERCIGAFGGPDDEGYTRLLLFVNAVLPFYLVAMAAAGA